MKQNWERSTEVFHLTLVEVTEIITTHFDKNALVTDVQLMSGGLSNSNFQIQLTINEKAEKIVLRCFTEPSKSSMEAELYTRLSEVIQTPKIYHHDDTQDIIAINYLLMEFIKGAPLVQILELLNLQQHNSEGVSRVYHEIGRIMGKIHSMSFGSHGFFVKHLEIGESFTIDPPFIQNLLTDLLKDLKNIIPPLLISHLNTYIVSILPLLDELHMISYFQTPRLIHGDFNEMNIFISDKNKGLELCIIDWEYAMSGHPFFDLGNVTRHIKPDQIFRQTKIAEGYELHGTKLPPNWYTIARGFDLIALFQMLQRPSLGSNARSDILRLIDRYYV